jgi:hypothetical protein
MPRLGAILAILLLVLGPARAEDRPILLLAPDVSSARALELRRAAAVRGLEVAAPEAAAEPASEAVLADVRPLYRDMAFARCAAKLDGAAEALVRGREASPALTRALAEVELWRGACRFLAGDKTGAIDHFVLARRLWPKGAPEPIFPPKVHAAFKSAKPQMPVPVAVHLAPAGARLWLDGVYIEGPLRASPGLHWAVVARPGFSPKGQLLRVIRGSAQVNVSLSEPARPEEILRALRFSAPSPAAAEALGRPVLMVAASGEGFRTTSLDGTALAEGEDVEALIEALCQRIGGCAPPPEKPQPEKPVVIVAPPPPPPPPPPVWKRRWFWGVVAGSVIVGAGVVTGAVLGATAPRDYVIYVR